MKQVISSNVENKCIETFQRLNQQNVLDITIASCRILKTLDKKFQIELNRNYDNCFVKTQFVIKPIAIENLKSSLTMPIIIEVESQIMYTLPLDKYNIIMDKLIRYTSFIPEIMFTIEKLTKYIFNLTFHVKFKLNYSKKQNEYQCQCISMSLIDKNKLCLDYEHETYEDIDWTEINTDIKLTNNEIVNTIELQFKELFIFD